MLLQGYKIHRDGFGFAFVFALLSYGVGCFYKPLGYLSMLSIVWCLYFFRVPFRSPPSGHSLVVSAADGRVVSIKEIVPPPEFGLGSEPRLRISVFLNIFDVHINYIPITGEVVHVYYEQGHFFNAAKDKASEHNEKNALVIKPLPHSSCTIGVVQIAGLVARRIRCEVKQGDHVQMGQYYGLIRFGSRQDIYLPKGTEVLVSVGDRVRAVQTILADLGPLLQSEDPEDTSL